MMYSESWYEFWRGLSITCISLALIIVGLLWLAYRESNKKQPDKLLIPEAHVIQTANQLNAVDAYPIVTKGEIWHIESDQGGTRRRLNNTLPKESMPLGYVDWSEGDKCYMPTIRFDNVPALRFNPQNRRWEHDFERYNPKRLPATAPKL